MSLPNGRREFLKKLMLGTLTAVPASMMASRILLGAAPAQAQAGGAKAPMVDEKDSAAMALGYRSDATKVDLKKYPKRAGAEGAKQFCYDCMFFQAVGDPKAAKTAPCQIFAGKQVVSKGWCNSWTQNPKVKA